MSLKLMIDKKSKKVVFAEASKEVVDFIFHILTLPLSTVVKVLQENKHEMSWCLDDLYKCIQSFDSACLVTGFNKISVLSPSTARIGPLLLPHKGVMSMTYYNCSSKDRCSSTFYCLKHKEVHMITDPVYDNASRSMNLNPQYVKGPMSYVVMDNLETKLMSLSLINSLVKDLTFVEEKDVKFGRDQAIDMLKASLETKSVLTTIFLGKN